MKKLIFFVFAFLLLGAMMPMTSCSRKSGCPMTEEATTKPNRKGNYKKGKSELFDKKTRKKMARR